MAGRFGRKIYTFETIDSTNTCAKALAGCWAAEGTVVFSETQTAGRGRLGRSWYSAPQQNLTFTIILRPSLPPDSVNLLPLFTGVVIAEAIEEHCGVAIECKWPNDLLIGGKKVAGILCEGSFKQDMVEYVTVGIGLNVNQETFPAPLQETATSLRLSLGHPVERTGLFRAIIASFEREYDLLAVRGYDSIVPRWLGRSSVVGRQIEVSQEGTMITGVVRGISAEGSLLLETPDGLKGLLAGDVTVLHMDYAPRS
jgi:BirA family transcriptional regulator, biotin operon repressor / biotin---[acetyl-CoA-carboxylase] ligase